MDRMYRKVKDDNATPEFQEYKAKLATFLSKTNVEDVDGYYSDLYLKVTPESTAFIKSLPFEYRIGGAFVSTFRSQIDNEMWYEIVFGNPYYNYNKEWTNGSKTDFSQVCMGGAISDSRRIKDDEYGSEMDFEEPEEKDLNVEVTFYWDNYLFENNYEDDFASGEYGLPEKIDWDLVTEISMEIDDALCGVVANYFNGGKNYCSYHSGTNGYGGDLTCFDTSVKESILYDKLQSFDIPYTDGEIREEYSNDIYLHLDNSNSDVYDMFGKEVDRIIDEKYTDEVSRRIARDIMEVYEMGADLYIDNPSDRIKELISQNI